METKFPRHLQRQIEESIVQNTFKIGTVLNTDNLAEQFNASPDEIHTVMEIAHRKGLVRKQSNHEYEVLGLSVPPRDSVFSHTEKLGFKPTSKVREVVVEPASAIVAQMLDLAKGAPVFRFVRTRFVNGEALANQTNHIPIGICPELAHDDVSHASFQKLLEEKYYTYTAEFKETFDVEPASEQDLEILNLPQGSSVLLVQRLAVSGTGFPVVLTNIHIHPNRWQYVSKLWPTIAAMFQQE